LSSCLFLLTGDKPPLPNLTRETGENRQVDQNHAFDCRLVGFQRGVMVGSSFQLGLPA
jgi:hypothetical protein